MKPVQAQITTGDGLKLFTQRWLPEGDVRGLLCLIHGLGEHSGRYAHVAEFFTQSGFAFAAFDLRGHGRSGGKRGHAPGFDTLLDDIGVFLDRERESFPEHPTFLYGHSLGGTLVLAYAMRRKPSLNGVISSGPLLEPAFKPPALKLAAGKLMRRIWPTFTMNNEVVPDDLSTSPQVVKAYIEDPLVHDRLSSQLGMDMLEAGAWNLAMAADFPLPLLLIHGSEDKLCSTQASRIFAERMGEACTIKMWDGLAHEIHNEPTREDVLNYVLDWIVRYS
jgi:alpha-beta hydrolase superfamily lysophospholipase